MTGITVCSILTATLSSALMNVTVERYDVITGKTVSSKSGGGGNSLNSTVTNTFIITIGLAFTDVYSLFNL